MAISKRSIFEAPQKSPYSFERCDSEMERWMMQELEADASVVKWQKRHSIRIPWVDSQGQERHYCPDFIVEYADGQLVVIEVKNPALMDSPSVRRKESAARDWCRQRGMTYELRTIK